MTNILKPWHNINDVISCVGCPHAKDPYSVDSGTGGPKPKTGFKGCDGKSYKRNNEGNIPDEYGKDHQRITNAPRTLSMANTGDPNSGGSQFFINVNHNSFLDWFDSSTDSKHPVFGKVCRWHAICFVLLFFSWFCTHFCRIRNNWLALFCLALIKQLQQIQRLL